MSSTPSSISSGPTKAGTHHSSMAQITWRCSLFLLIICTWQVAEIEFQCHLAWFVISNTSAMRPELAANPNGCLKGNMIYSDEKGEQLPAKVECQMGSAVLKREVHSRCWRGVEWKRRVPNLGCGVLMGFEEHPYWRRRAETWAGQECGMLYRSTKPARGAPMGIEDHR